MYRQVRGMRQDGRMDSSPLHSQVWAALRERIGDGAIYPPGTEVPPAAQERIDAGQMYRPGADLPSEAELCAEFGVSRSVIRQALGTLMGEGLISVSRGKPAQVRKERALILNASRFENLQFSDRGSGDSYSNEVLGAGRRPRQEFKVEMVKLAPPIARRLGAKPGETAVLRRCLRFVDDVPWSTQATYYKKHLADAHPRLADPGDIPEGTTRYLADHGIKQVGYHDEVFPRMPNPTELHELHIGKGVPVLVWVRTGFTAEQAVRCTVSTFRGDLSHLVFEHGDLSALESRAEGMPS